jgi:hypothetical protein
MPLSFNGVSHIVWNPVGAGTPLASMSGDFSVMCWINPVGIQKTFASMSSRAFINGSNNFSTFQVDAATPRAFLVFFSAGSAGLGFTQSSLLAGWNHVAAVRVGTTVSGYLNGVLMGSGVNGSSITAGAGLKFVLGGDRTESNSFKWTGLIDDVRWYNRALSLAEIQTIHGGRGVDGIVDGLVNRMPLKELAPGAAPGAGAVKDVSGAQLGGSATVGVPAYGDGILRFRRKTA